MSNSHETIPAQELDDIPKKPSANDTHWGYHLLLDMSGCNDNIDNHSKIEDFLKELVNKLDMKTIGKPIIVSVHNEQGRGTSAVQIITTSTITFHGDDDKHCVYLDVFSCKTYNPRIVFEAVEKYFTPKHIGHKWIYRDAGSYPKGKALLKADMTPSQLGFPVFLMNFPFTVNNSEPNNAWMDKKKNQEYNYEKAFSQFMNLYQYITKYSLVYIVPSEGNFQDQAFVANLGCYLSHLSEDTILLANFKSKPRIGEEQSSIKFFSSMGYEVIQSPFKWEGEADLKYIRDNIYVAGYGMRTDIKSHRWMEAKFQMKVVSVKMNDPKLYHFDCIFCPLSEHKALVATKGLASTDLKAIEKIVEIIDIPEKFIYNGWTNLVVLGDKVLHAPASNIEGKEEFKKFIEKIGYEPIIFDLSEYEKSGADLSCMIMHLNYHNRDSYLALKASNVIWWTDRIQKLPNINVKAAIANIVNKTI